MTPIFKEYHRPFFHDRMGEWRMASLRTVSVILAAGLIALSGCGGDDDNGGGGGGDDQLGGEAARLTPPEKPTPEDCGGEAVASDKKADEGLVPKPGTYVYDVKGTRGESGAGADTALPKTAELRVTPSTKMGNVVCFRAQTVYTPKEADTVTFVVRGGDIYITKLDFFVAGQTPEIVPQPAIKAVDGSGAEQWQGTWSGPTTGSYKAVLQERQEFSFEGKTENVPGVQLDFEFKGELNGKSSQLTYASLEGGTLYQQKVEQERGFGGTSVTLKYDWKLKSFSGG
jgi:hypothetical protein